jgi:hypothetical protein
MTDTRSAPSSAGLPLAPSRAPLCSADITRLGDAGATLSVARGVATAISPSGSDVVAGDSIALRCGGVPQKRPKCARADCMRDPHSNDGCASTLPEPVLTFDGSSWASGGASGTITVVAAPGVYTVCHKRSAATSFKPTRSSVVVRQPAAWSLTDTLVSGTATTVDVAIDPPALAGACVGKNAAAPALAHPCWHIRRCHRSHGPWRVLRRRGRGGAAELCLGRVVASVPRSRRDRDVDSTGHIRCLLHPQHRSVGGEHSRLDIVPPRESRPRCSAAQISSVRRVAVVQSGTPTRLVLTAPAQVAARQTFTATATLAGADGLPVTAEAIVSLALVAPAAMPPLALDGDTVLLAEVSASFAVRLLLPGSFSIQARATLADGTVLLSAPVAVTAASNAPTAVRMPGPRASAMGLTGEAQIVLTSFPTRATTGRTSVQPQLQLVDANGVPAALPAADAGSLCTAQPSDDAVHTAVARAGAALRSPCLAR